MSPRLGRFGGEGMGKLPLVVFLVQSLLGCFFLGEEVPRELLSGGPLERSSVDVYLRGLLERSTWEVYSSGLLGRST